MVLIQLPRFRKGDLVRVEGEDLQAKGKSFFVGKIVTVDRLGGGIHYGTEASYDIEGSFDEEQQTILYKHVADSWCLPIG